MYGHSPPAVVWVNPDLVSTCAGMQETAAWLAKMLADRPVHAVVCASSAWRTAPEGAREMALESLRLEPGLVDPAHPDAEMARILAEHLERLGWPLSHGPTRPEVIDHAPASRVWSGTIEDAAAVARRAGADRITVRGGETPARVGGVPVVRDGEG